jgi:hypothetical protein
MYNYSDKSYNNSFQSYVCSNPITKGITNINDIHYVLHIINTYSQYGEKEVQ